MTRLGYHIVEIKWRLLLLLVLYPGIAATADPNSLLQSGRTQFYRATQSEAALDSAIATFRMLRTDSSIFEALVDTYLGALTCLQGKHALLPTRKLSLVNKGLAKMDKAISRNPKNVEALFVRASTTFYLPFFFNRGEQAQEDMQRLSELLPGHAGRFPDDLVQNVAEFLLENGDLDDTQRRELLIMQERLALR